METPILARLKDEYVFTVKLQEENTKARIRERCDRYFSVELTKSEMLALSGEIKGIAEQMEE